MVEFMENFNGQNQYPNNQQGYQQQGYQQQGYQQQGYQQQTYQQPNYQTVPPSSHLVGAILATLFCCLPFGIPAIVYASKVESRWYAGDHQGAIEASNSARNWCWHLSFRARCSAFYTLFFYLQ